MKKSLLTAIILFAGVSIYAQSSKKYNVEIVRDSFGVPHIFGKTDADCAYGLVWAECEDDFVTVQWGLLLAKSMLGRHLGIDGAKIDYAVQLLRIRQTIDEHYEKDLSPEFKKILEASADAGNHYAELHPEEVLVKKAMPVGPKDFIAGYMLAMALMTGVDGALGQMVDGTVPQVSFAEKGRGSNAIAMNSHKTADGLVYLDVNSHQPLEGPLSWYEAHLQSEEGMNMYGSTFHGGVTIFHGVNENLGWAHTTNGFDAIDIYQLEPDPKKKNLYLVDGVSHKLETGRAKLSVNLAKHPDKKKFILTIGKKIWWSKFGATVVNKKGMFAIRLASNMTIKAPEQWYRMDKARNFTEFRHALDIQGIVNQNITYADRFDTIFFISNGAFPKRAEGYDWTTTVPGNTEKTLWTEFFPETAIPQVLNPDCGYVFNANNTCFSSTCAASNPVCTPNIASMCHDTTMTNRGMRFVENIAKYDKVSWDDFLKIKYDNHYPANPVFFKKFQAFDIVELKEEEHPDIADALKVLKAWNRTADVKNMNAALSFKVFYYIYNNTNRQMEKQFATDKKAKFEFFVKAIQEVKKDMLANFGTLTVPLGDYQRHQRGDVDLPIEGGADLWDAKYGNPYTKGRIRVWLGESFILLAKFTKDGPQFRTISPYGTSNKPGSKHYTDQMQLYVNHQTKEESLDKKWAYDHAERIYTPEMK
ncbi:MAG TPA: penicillin acylase family protein [Chitinophagales bacterium]|nr:penicillin acylase family protein [Chitinophagales bacterium]